MWAESSSNAVRPRRCKRAPGRISAVQPEYTREQKSQAKAAVLATGSLNKARDLLVDAWETTRPPSKDSLSRWKADPSILPDLDWGANAQIERVETIRAGTVEMYEATKARFLKELPDLSWNDVQHAQFSLGILADKILGRPGSTVNIDARQAHLHNGNGPRVILPFGPKLPAPDDAARVVEGEATELPAGRRG